MPNYKLITALFQQTSEVVALSRFVGSVFFPKKFSNHDLMLLPTLNIASVIINPIFDTQAKVAMALVSQSLGITITAIAQNIFIAQGIDSDVAFEYATGLISAMCTITGDIIEQLTAAHPEPILPNPIRGISL
jgi:hypothetical protein